MRSANNREIQLIWIWIHYINKVKSIASTLMLKWNVVGERVTVKKEAN